jgi:hypothetical protein
LDKIRNTYITEQRRRNKMSQVIDNLCEDSGGDNGERPNTASVPPLPVSGKRPRDKEESENGPVKQEKGSAKFVVDLNLRMKWIFHHMESDLLLLPK